MLVDPQGWGVCVRASVCKCLRHYNLNFLTAKELKCPAGWCNKILMTNASFLLCSLRSLRWESVQTNTHLHTHTPNYHATSPAAVVGRCLTWHQIFKHNEWHSWYVLNKDSQYDSNICLKAAGNRTFGNNPLVLWRNKLSAQYVNHTFTRGAFHIIYERFWLRYLKLWQIELHRFVDKD